MRVHYPPITIAIRINQAGSSDCGQQSNNDSALLKIALHEAKIILKSIAEVFYSNSSGSMRMKSPDN
jgi:hypothetical protein